MFHLVLRHLPPHSSDSLQQPQLVEFKMFNQHLQTLFLQTDFGRAAELNHCRVRLFPAGSYVSFISFVGSKQTIQMFKTINYDCVFVVFIWTL